MSGLARIIDLPSWRDGSSREARPDWCLSALTGRLVELSSEASTAALTLAFGLVLEAQREGEPVCWISSPRSSFFPVDAHDGGIDLDALVVVRIGDPKKLGRAADHLARCGAFGLVVIDFDGPAFLSIAMQSRLLGLAQKHQTVVLFLTRKGAELPSLGSLISLRGQSKARQTRADRFECELDIVKDKRRSPGWKHRELCRGPLGLE